MSEIVGVRREIHIQWMGDGSLCCGGGDDGTPEGAGMKGDAEGAKGRTGERGSSASEFWESSPFRSDGGDGYDRAILEMVDERSWSGQSAVSGEE